MVKIQQENTKVNKIYK